MIKKTNIPVAIALAYCFSWISAEGQSKDPLIFPKDNFTVETRMVKTSSGEKKITYHSYRHILYVAKPVDKDFQSMDLSVPVKIDDVTIEATNAPIFFSIGIGGYMSVRNGGNAVSRAGADATAGRGASGPGGQPGGMLPGADGSGGTGSLSSRIDLALAAGFVVVTPGCRGRDNKADDGTFYGKAPAAIVDLSSAILFVAGWHWVSLGLARQFAFTVFIMRTHLPNQTRNNPVFVALFLFLVTIDRVPLPHPITISRDR